jgi:hypothetical protein
VLTSAVSVTGSFVTGSYELADIAMDDNGVGDPLITVAVGPVGDCWTNTTKAEAAGTAIVESELAFTRPSYLSPKPSPRNLSNSKDQSQDVDDARPSASLRVRTQPRHQFIQLAVVGAARPSSS